MVKRSDEDDALIKLLQSEFNATDSTLTCHTCGFAHQHAVQEAANDPSYPQFNRSRANFYQSSDNKCANLSRFYLFFANRRKWRIWRLIGLIAALVLGFLIFLESLAQGQSSHSPTLAHRN